MGQCGCGDHQEGFTLPGPGGTIYHLSMYSGCQYCFNGPWWTIYRLEAKEEDAFEMRRDPEMRFHENGTAHLATFDLDDFWSKLKSNGEETAYDRVILEREEVVQAMIESAHSAYDKMAAALGGE